MKQKHKAGFEREVRSGTILQIEKKIVKTDELMKIVLVYLPNMINYCCWHIYNIIFISKLA